jgi:hypothetical protein
MPHFSWQSVVPLLSHMPSRSSKGVDSAPQKRSNALLRAGQSCRKPAKDNLKCCYPLPTFPLPAKPLRDEFSRDLRVLMRSFLAPLNMPGRQFGGHSGTFHLQRIAWFQAKFVPHRLWNHDSSGFIHREVNRGGGGVGGGFGIECGDHDAVIYDMMMAWQCAPRSISQSRFMTGCASGQKVRALRFAR